MTFRVDALQNFRRLAKRLQDPILRMAAASMGSPAQIENSQLARSSSGCTSFRSAFIGILTLAVALRITQYRAGRSLWADEASLALNFFEHGYGKFFAPLENGQVAPIGFNILSEFAVQVGGISEWSLRFFPMLFGLASVFAFWRMSRCYLTGIPLAFANYAFAISSTLIFYSNEFKPYVLDVLLSISLVYSISAWWERGRTGKHLLWLLFIGSSAVWFSFPAVFVMAGAGSTVMLACARERLFRELGSFGIVVVAWLLSFAAQYMLFARHIAQMSDLTSYWLAAGGFMPLPPWQGNGITWFTSNFFNYFSEVAGLHHSRNIMQFIFLCGIVELSRRRAFTKLGVFLAPILVAVLVSGFEIYPFQGRLALFTVPLALVICGEGIRALTANLQPSLLCALVAIALFSPSAYSIPLLWRPAKVEEARPLVEYINREADAEDLVFVFEDNPSFAFYRRQLGLRQIALPFGRSDVPDARRRIAQALESGRRCWLFFSHFGPEERASVLSQIESVGLLGSAVEEVGAELLMIEGLKTCNQIEHES